MHPVTTAGRAVESLQRKEVNTMEYSKPEVMLLGPAVVVIQGSGKKNTDPNPPHTETRDMSDCELED